MATRKAKPAPRKKTRTAASTRARKAPARVPRSEPATLRLRSIAPGLTVNDLERSIAFYTEALGFIVSERWNDDGGKLRGVMLKAGSCEIGLTQDDWARGRERSKGEGMRLWLETAQEVDALATRIQKAGFQIKEGPRNLPWGGRAITFDDLDGYHYTIFQEQ